MPEFQYKKLVRDLIPAKHVARGHTVSGRQLTGQDLKAALIEKLHEEADEVGSALSRDELIEEIGDVQQVINDLCTTQSISPEDLAQSMAIKPRVEVDLLTVNSSIAL